MPFSESKINPVVCKKKEDASSASDQRRCRLRRLWRGEQNEQNRHFCAHDAARAERSRRVDAPSVTGANDSSAPLERAMTYDEDEQARARTPTSGTPSDGKSSVRRALTMSLVRDGNAHAKSAEKASMTTPRRAMGTPGPTATPLSVHVSSLVKEAMTALKTGRARLDELVRSHRGRGLVFNDEPESPVGVRVRAERASPSVSATTASLEDREAAREATDALLRSAKKSMTPTKALCSPRRSPRPAKELRVRAGDDVPVLADSAATASALRADSAVDTQDDEVTSQISLPSGFDPSEFIDAEPKKNVSAVEERSAPDAALDAAAVDAFARMMAKVITDTREELRAAAKKEEAFAEPSSPERPADAEATTPRRRSRRKSSVKPVDDAPETPSRRTGRSKEPATPTRRSRRLASKGRK